MERRALLGVLAGSFVSCLNVASAQADAVPPPPEVCPKGQVGVTSHSGPACVPEAPDDCAPGYRGRVGGDCVLASCHSDDQCDDGERCMQVDTCQEFRELHWTGWGWSAQRPVRSGNFFAGPPRPRPDGPPKKAWVELNICGQDGACVAPAECRPSSLCYPAGAIGKTKAKVTELGAASPPAPSTAAPVPELPASGSATPATPGAAAENGDAPPADGGGCRKGCSSTARDVDAGWLGVPLWLATALVMRRRRRPNGGLDA